MPDFFVFDADIQLVLKNPNLLCLLECGVEFVKAADEEVADETTKEVRFVTQQDTGAVAQTFAGLVRDEAQVE